jgi:hypothetical protein
LEFNGIHTLIKSGYDKIIVGVSSKERVFYVLNRHDLTVIKDSGKEII